MADVQPVRDGFSPLLLNYGLPLGAGVGAIVAFYSMLAALGFGGKGITAGSFAATTMSVATRTGVGTWLVASLQSIGVTGLSWSTIFVTMGAVGCAVRFFLREARP